MSRRHTPAPPFVAPRAYVDPVDSADDALAIIRLAMSDPLRHETLTFLLDHDSRGGTITVVSGTDRPEAIFAVLELMCRVANGVPELCSVVIATVRPDDRDEHGGSDRDGDAQRWLAASALADGYGVELVEWFVIGPGGVELPRARAGDDERW